MKRATRKAFHTHSKWRLSAIALLALLTMPGFALVEAVDECDYEIADSQDIKPLTASFEASGDITEMMELGADADNKTKYRVHFDHTAPVADQRGDQRQQGGECHTTSGGVITRNGSRHTGPGVGEDSDASKLIDLVDMSVLRTKLVIDDEALAWADTQHEGSVPRDPNAYRKDRVQPAPHTPPAPRTRVMAPERKIPECVHGSHPQTSECMFCLDESKNLRDNMREECRDDFNRCRGRTRQYKKKDTKKRHLEGCKQKSRYCLGRATDAENRYREACRGLR